MHDNVAVGFTIITPRPIFVKWQLGLSDRLNIYGSFEFLIQANITLGYGGEIALERERL